MKKLICLLTACLLLTAMTLNVFADTSDAFKDLGKDQQMEDSKTDEEMNALFEQLGSMMTPLEEGAETEEAAEIEEDTTGNTLPENLLVIVVTLVVFFAGYVILRKKKH